MEIQLREVKIKDTIFGYNTLVKEGDVIIALKGENVPELKIGMMVVLSGDSRGYVPSGFNPKDEVTIEEFTEPFLEGNTDHIVKVSNEKRSGWIKPSNIELILANSEYSSFTSNTFESSSEEFEVLDYGSKGERVKEIQSALKLIGFFKSAVDGIYGRSTTSAIMNFQKDLKLPHTGRLDEKTYIEILKIVAVRSGDEFPSQKIHSEVSSESKEEKSNFIDQQTESHNISSDIINAVTTKAEQFIQEFDKLKSEFSDWYNDPIDEKDIEFSSVLGRVTDIAKRISGNRENYLANYARDGKYGRLSADAGDFSDSIIEIVSKCEELEKHYSAKLKNEELINSLRVLSIFKSTAQRFADEMRYIVSSLQTPAPSSVDPRPTPPEIDKSASSPLLKEIFTSINSDVPDPEAPDSLGITPDVDALASVIAYKDLKTPLAIGLFGHWGSGKSFFMKKLQKRIESYAEDEGDDFVKHVVHIEFNSWHYSDSNLWASFVTKIFEALNEYANGYPNEIASLFAKLNSSGEFLIEAENKRDGITSTIEKLTKKLQFEKNEIERTAAGLKSIPLRDIVFTVLNDKEVSKPLDDIKKMFPDRTFESIEDINRNANELQSFYGKLTEAVKLIYSFRSWKAWVTVALFFILLSTPWLLNNVFKVQFEIFSFSFIKILSIAAALFSQAGIIINHATGPLNEFTKKLQSIRNTCNQLEAKERSYQQSKIDNIQSELNRKREALNQQEAEISKLQKVKAETISMIDDIKSGKKLASFIAGRVTDEKYINSLGIISWVRKDFDQLDKELNKIKEANAHFQKQLEEKKKAGIPVEDTEAQKEPPFQIDRIVLYIDDLDRCNEDIVVKVLEAIHLLLAFKLFVVVVGVDPRWMHNALNNKYNKQLKKNTGEKEHDKINVNVHRNNNAINVEINEDEQAIYSATSYDYLEKIFQVPFALNEIDRKGKDSLIEALTKTHENSVEENAVADESVSTTDETEIVEKTEPDLNRRTIPVSETTNSQGKGNTEKEIKRREEEKNRLNEAAAKEKGAQKILVVEDEKKKSMSIKRAKEQLVISLEEINFMKSISELIGNSPRTINRYINIYRIIRSHSSLPKTETPIQDYCAVMVLLGIITGMPNESKEFYKHFTYELTGTFIDFVSRFEFQSLQDACKVPFNISESSQKTVGELPIAFMKERFELVQRFSFRNYSDNDSAS